MRNGGEHVLHITSHDDDEQEDDDLVLFFFLCGFVCVVLLLSFICFSSSSSYFVRYSWILSSFTGAVYTFGFIMMTPQLYLNYKYKSVAHLPWRMLTYKVSCFCITVISSISMETRNMETSEFF